MKEKLKDISFADLLYFVYNGSVCYKDSKAFRKSIEYIKNVDVEFAKELLYIEMCSMWDEEYVNEVIEKLID